VFQFDLNSYFLNLYHDEKTLHHYEFLMNSIIPYFTFWYLINFFDLNIKYIEGILFNKLSVIITFSNKYFKKQWWFNLAIKYIINWKKCMV